MRALTLGLVVSALCSCAAQRMNAGEAMPKEQVKMPRELTWCPDGQWLRLDMKSAWESSSFKADMTACQEIFNSESTLQARPRTDEYVLGAYVDDAGKLTEVCLRRVTAGDTPRVLACLHHVLSNTRIGEGVVAPGFAIDVLLKFDLKDKQIAQKGVR